MKFVEILIAMVLSGITGFTNAQDDYAELDWDRTYLGPDSSYSEPAVLELDKSGNIYVGLNDGVINRTDITYTLYT